MTVTEITSSTSITSAETCTPRYAACHASSAMTVTTRNADHEVEPKSKPRKSVIAPSTAAATKP
jgi:hypothetical protein